MRVSVGQRRALLGSRHLLDPSARAASTEQVAERLSGLHATDAASVVLSAWARLRQPSLAEVNRALYDDRTLVRMHCMRRTLFVVPAGKVPVFHYAVGEAVAVRERANLLKHLSAANSAWDERWLSKAGTLALQELTVLGEATTGEITDRVPELQSSVVMSPGKPYESRQRAGGWVLRLLAMQGRIQRTRPVGGWTSGQFRYVIATVPEPMPVEQAQAELARAWLSCYGPATAEDLKWWTGWNLSDTRRALAKIGAVDVELTEGTGWVLPGDALDDPPPQHWVALLPSLDPATMGWKHRDWYVDPAHRPQIFDSAGNGGPTVWCDGEIIGGWAQRRDATIAWRLLADRGADVRKAVAHEAAQLEQRLAEHDLRVNTPAPMTRELTT